MYRIGGIPVLSLDGSQMIGLGMVRVEDDGNVLIQMELANNRGRELAEMLKHGLTGALSFGPINTPAVAPLRD